MGDISNSLQPLCHCKKRDLVLGRRAYVCQVCEYYDPSKANTKISEIYDESRKKADIKIKEKKIEFEDFEFDEIKLEEEVDLTIDEFEEEDEEIPLKFEKRKAGKEEVEDSEEFAQLECPFCGEISDNLAAHIRECEFAPDDVNVDDFLPSKPKKKRKKKATTTTSAKKKVEEGASQEKNTCPYCGKEFVRLGRHVKYCPKRPESGEVEETD